MHAHTVLCACVPQTGRGENGYGSEQSGSDNEEEGDEWEVLDTEGLGHGRGPGRGQQAQVCLLCLLFLSVPYPV